MTDYTLVDTESALLGQEFLTWLWFASEVRGGVFQTPDGQSFSVHMRGRITVEGGEGDSKATTTVVGAYSELPEAKLGVVTGKKVNRAQLVFERDGEAWSVQVKAEDFGLGSLRTPKVESKREEGEDPDGAFLEKVYLLELAVGFFDVVFQEFLDRRLDRTAWNRELAGFARWLHAKPESY